MNRVRLIGIASGDPSIGAMLQEVAAGAASRTQGVEHRIDLAANILRVGDGAWPQDLVGDLVGEVAEQLVRSRDFSKPSA